MRQLSSSTSAKPSKFPWRPSRRYSHPDGRHSLIWLAPDRETVVVCHHGVRSAQVDDVTGAAGLRSCAESLRWNRRVGTGSVNSALLTGCPSRSVARMVLSVRNAGGLRSEYFARYRVWPSWCCCHRFSGRRMVRAVHQHRMRPPPRLKEGMCCGMGRRRPAGVEGLAR